MSDFNRIQKAILKDMREYKQEREAKKMKAKLKKFFEDIMSVATSRKFYIALIGFALTLVQLYIQPVPDWYGPLVAFLTAAGVYSVPNKK